MWNGPINGDYSKCDWMQAPWANIIATLTHEECVFVIENRDKIIAEYAPTTPWDNPTPSRDYVLDKYNNLTNWEKAINGYTYDCLVGYDPEFNTLGINENGIIAESVEDVEPVEETPTEEDVPQETEVE